MIMRRFVQAALLASALITPTLASADDAAMAEAQKRFTEGLERADSGKFDEARLKFLQAYAVLKAPAVLFNLASSEQKTNHDVEAIEHYRAFLRSGVNDTRITDAMREKAKANIAELLKKVGQVEIDAPEGAKISVDSVVLDEAPKEPVAVAAGKHKIEATFGGKVKSVTVDAKVGEIAKAKLDFTAGGPDITTPPRVDDGGERTTVGWAVPISLAVLGVGGVVVGGVFASASQSSKDESATLGTPGVCASPTSTACAAYDAKRDDAESQATLSYVGYVAGGVLLAGAVATFLFWPKSGTPRNSSSLKLAPVVGPRTAGGSLQLHF
jgi:hypothetical protein